VKNSRVQKALSSGYSDGAARLLPHLIMRTHLLPHLTMHHSGVARIPHWGGG